VTINDRHGRQGRAARHHRPRHADYGIKLDAKEAIAFAVLAHETSRGRASNFPSATGARRAVVLGKSTQV